MNTLFGKDLRHSRRAHRLGWILLVMLSAALLLSLLIGIRSLGAA
jgi:hypothetical protein